MSAARPSAPPPADDPRPADPGEVDVPGGTRPGEPGEAALPGASRPGEPDAVRTRPGEVGAVPVDGTRPGGPDRAEGPGADPGPEPGPAQARGLAALAGEDFSIAQAMGGWRGLVESTAPGLVFVVVYVVMRGTPQELIAPLIASLAVALVAVVIRLIGRSSVTQALGGIVGVVIGVVWAWWTGRAQDYFAGGLIANAAYMLGTLISILVRWPVVGLVVGIFRGGATAGSLGAWRSDRDLMRRATWASWLWVAMFGARLLVQVPAYFAGEVAWLGTAKLLMGVPLFALVLWFSWLLVRRSASAAPDPHAGRDAPVAPAGDGGPVG